MLALFSSIDKGSNSSVCALKVRRLSPHTNVVDCTKMVKLYLQSVGHRGCTIGATPVFVAYRKPVAPERGCRVQVGIGATEEEALQSANAGSSQPTNNSREEHQQQSKTEKS
jgi:hypothetical protein